MINAKAHILQLVAAAWHLKCAGLTMDTSEQALHAEQARRGPKISDTHSYPFIFLCKTQFFEWG